MCPFCMQSLGIAVAYIVSTGGLAALAAKVARKSKKSDEDAPTSGERSKNHGNKQDGESKGGVPR